MEKISNTILTTKNLNENKTPSTNSLVKGVFRFIYPNS